MLSDEERKAIERIEDVFYQDLGKGINKFQKITLYEDSITDIRTVLNLIEKQSKEIEELKNADLTTVYLNGFYDGEKKVKDKIKAKIEYYEKIDNAVGVRILESLLKKE